MSSKVLSRAAAIVLIAGSAVMVAGAVSLGFNADTDRATGSILLMLAGTGISMVGTVLTLLAARRKKNGES